MAYNNTRRLYQNRMCCLGAVDHIQWYQLNQLAVDRAMVDEARKDLGINQLLLRIPMYEAKDMPEHIRGQVNSVLPLRYHVYLNPVNAGDDTVLHELRHVHQILYGYIDSKSLEELEEDAQDWAERQLAKGRFRGILKVG